MITIEGEFEKFISLAEVLVKLAIAKNSEIHVAAEILKLNLIHEPHWKQFKYIGFCREKCLTDITDREKHLITETLDALENSIDADSLFANKLLAVTSIKRYIPETMPYHNEIVNSEHMSTVIEFIEYHNPCFDCYGFARAHIEKPFSLGLKLLELNEKKFFIHNNTFLGDEEKQEQLQKIKEEIEVTKKQYSQSDTQSVTKESTYLNIISTLLGIINGQHGGAKHPDFANQSELINEIENKFEGYSGLSKRTLENIFAKAKKNIP